MVYKLLLIVISCFIFLLIILISKLSERKLRPISINHMNQVQESSINQKANNTIKRFRRAALTKRPTIQCQLCFPPELLKKKTLA